MELTNSQKVGFSTLESKSNCFLTGHAGTGKTYLLNKWIKANSHKKLKVLASTGMASVLINGRTFHSFFGIGIAEGPDAAIIAKAVDNTKTYVKIRTTDIIVIDEISMIPGRLLNIAENICRICRDSDAPWGGIKIVTVGDFGQLPPINKDSNQLDWAFNSEAWVNSNFSNILLTEPLRTDNKEFLTVLDDVRAGDVTDRLIKFIESKATTEKDSYDFVGTRLYPFVAKAEEYNLLKLDEINEPLISIPTTYTYAHESYLAQIKKSIPIADVINIKPGALVMIRVNDEQLRWVNGTLAHVMTYDAVNKQLILKYIDRDTIFTLGKHMFEIRDDKNKLLASATNYPINLAWACTIHKSQGASIDRLIIDMGGIWEYGQAYVALSRTSNPDNLRIINPNPHCVKTHPMVKNFYHRLRS